MLQQLLRTCTTPNIHAKTHTQERLQVLAQLLWILKSWSSVSSDQVKCLEWLLVEIRWLGFNHFDSHDAQRPDINLWSVLLLLDDFGSHPVRRTDHGCALGFGFSEFGTEAEVGDFDVAARVKKDVVGFDVTMDDVLLVQVVQAAAGLIKLVRGIE